MDDYYLKLRKQYTVVAEEESFEITLPELTDIFQCSARNVNLVLRRMEQEGWIRWEPGRGRGHRSKLTFLIKAETVALQTAQAYVKKGVIQQAFAYLEEQAHLPYVKEQFAYWLDTMFGYRPEVRNEQTLDTLRLPYCKPIPCLDPAHLTFVIECQMARQVFDTLVNYNNETDTIEPGLAHYWNSNSLNTEWTFYLRKGVYFHHGKELTAHDVRFTIQRLRGEEGNSPFRWLFEGVEEIVAFDKYTVLFRLRRANPLFLHHLSLDRASIVPEDAVTELGDVFRRQPIGTGPFKVVQHDENMIVLEAFTRYYDKRAHLDRIEVWFTPELERKASHLEPVSYQMRYHVGKSASEVPSGWNVVETIGRDCTFLTFNLRREGCHQRLGFRKACLHGLDRRALIESMRGMEGTAAIARWFYDQLGERSDTDEQYDPVYARKCMEESGYQGERLLLAISPSFQEIAEEILRQWGELGIQADLQLIPYEHEERARLLSEAHVSMSCNVMDHDPELSIIEIFLADNSCVRPYLGKDVQQQIEWLIDRLYQEGSSLTRKDYLRKVQQMITDQSYILFLFHTSQRTVLHPSLKNISLNSLGWVHFRDLWFEPSFES
ncbi:ABC transporter substrate-binding protein [Paenibacillus silviterrae]|uniref:ABC transporter substrate-binding protein n=1 Tax=Paenibacillus silviterrae TaxID=3242194 RepID=UPI0025427E3A|nr:ABC transporter substrate-binding protein [Paenibacillus chinjuensis]